MRRPGFAIASVFTLWALALLVGCVNALLKGVRPDGSKVTVMYYPVGGR